MNLTYSQSWTSIIRFLGLREVARKLYYQLYKPKDGIFVIEWRGVSARFCARDAVELRTVELAFLSEQDTLADVIDALRTGDVFLDVGANLGLFSVFAGRAGARVIACEPETVALERLTANQHLNGLEMHIVHAALSDVEETGYLFQPTKTDIIQHAHLSNEGIPVQTLVGDSIVSRADIIKIDVEGHEVRVLKGLGNTLRYCRFCIVEVHNGIDEKEVAAILADAGLHSEIRKRNREQLHVVGKRV